MVKKVCIAGNFEIAVQCANFILTKYKDCSLFAVLNESDEGVNTWQPSYKKFCIDKNIEILKLQDCYQIKDLIFISLHYDKIIKIENFKSKRLFNLHFSLLPAYKGMHTSAFPLLNGEEFSGVTIHDIDNGIDTGNIIAQKKFKINIDDNAKDLFLKYIDNGIKLFKKTAKSLISNNYKSYPQPSIGSNYFNKSSINFKKITINLNNTAFQIHNQIRAFAFEEYQLPEILGYKIYKSKITDRKSKYKSGKVVFNKANVLQLATIDYDIKLYKK